MTNPYRAMIRDQFGAAIDTLKNAIGACPDNLWPDNTKSHPFWYVTFHTLFWLDYYLSWPSSDYTPPEPFTLSELDPAGAIPDRPYTKAELLTYLDHGRSKCHAAIEAAPEDLIHVRHAFGRTDMTIAELWLYTLRHVQHHAAQLNLILRLETGAAPRWVFHGDR